MSKEKPEVGDVFASDFGAFYRVEEIYFDPNRVVCFILDWDDNGEKYYLDTDVVDLKVLKNCKYLGKSKVSIKELFYVE